MVVKKKKGSKKKKKTADTVGSGDPANAEGLSVDGDGAATSGRKKSGKKKKGLKGKLSVADKLLVKLEKGVELLKSHQKNFEHFVQVADTWLIQYGNKLKEMLKRKDSSDDGVITYDEMKSALYDLDCPMNMVEIHLLCKLLDTDNSGEIDYMQLKEGLRHYMKLSIDHGEDEYSNDSDDEIAGGNFTLSRGQSAKDIEHCRCCKVGLWLPTQPTIQYAEVTMMLITFADTLKKHPCHFTKVLHTHLTIYGLIQLIKSEVGIQSSTISVFRDKSRSAEAELANDLTLEECGYEGRDWYNPMEHVIYYDYTSEFNSCPILMCDHYFTNKLRIS